MDLESWLVRNGVDAAYAVRIDAAANSIHDALSDLLDETGDLVIVAYALGYVEGRFKGWLDVQRELTGESHADE